MFTEEKFIKNRDEALKAEAIAVDLFAKMGIQVELNQTPKDNRYLDDLRKADLLYAGKPYAEIKCDWKSVLTGNVCVETGSLFRSQAPYVVYVLPAYFCAPRTQILDHSEAIRGIRGGDFNAEIKLIPRSDFVRLPFMKRIG